MSRPCPATRQSRPAQPSGTWARAGVDGLADAAIDNEYASAAAGLRRVAAQAAGRAA